MKNKNMRDLEKHWSEQRKKAGKPAKAVATKKNSSPAVGRNVKEAAEEK